MKDEIRKYLIDIKISIEAINSYIEGKKIFSEFENNRLVRMAVERELEIIGEAVSRIKKADNNFPISSAAKIKGTYGQVEVPAGGHEKSPPLDEFSGGRCRGAGSCRAGLFHPVGLALGGDDDGVVEQPIEEADRGGVFGEEPSPFFEGPVGSDAE